MSLYKGRYFGGRDVRLMNSLNGEIMTNLIQQEAIVYKIDPNLTKQNFYGESHGSKMYFPGVIVPCLISFEAQITDNEFLANRKRNIVLKFHRLLCEQRAIYPEQGDVAQVGETYYEINSLVENQLLGGQWNKSFSIVCNAHQTKVTSLHITPRRV